MANLIGLVCRFIFQPAEESASILFSSTQKPDLNSLRKYLQIMIAIGSGAIIFSKTCGMQFLLIIYSNKWATESCYELLQAYCIYCFFMAMNGIAEAYVFAKGSTDVLKTLRKLMLLNSITYIGLSYFLSQSLGIIGLVYSNCFNM